MLKECYSDKHDHLHLQKDAFKTVSQNQGIVGFGRDL